MQEIKILDGKLYLNPGGTYDMIKGNFIEHQVAKMHLLVALCEKIVEGLCDHNELIEERTPYCHELMAIAEKHYDAHYKDLVENYSQHKIEFPRDPKYPITVPKWLEQEPWVDQSWHHDACPSFLHPDCSIIVWINYDKEEHRELCLKKFYVNSVVIDPVTEAQEYDCELFECDTEEELKHWLETATF